MSEVIQPRLIAAFFVARVLGVDNLRAAHLVSELNDDEVGQVLATEAALDPADKRTAGQTVDAIFAHAETRRREAAAKEAQQPVSGGGPAPVDDRKPDDQAAAA